MVMFNQLLEINGNKILQRDPSEIKSYSSLLFISIMSNDLTSELVRFSALYGMHNDLIAHHY